MEPPVPHPHTINTLRWGADAAFAMLAGGQLWKLRIPEVEAVSDDALPPALRKITQEMQRRYLTNDFWYRRHDGWWLAAGAASAAQAHDEATGSA